MQDSTALNQAVDDEDEDSDVIMLLLLLLQCFMLVD